MINESYMTVARKLPDILASIQAAGVPPRFTTEFLTSLGHKSTNDRNVIAVLKGIGFLDNTGVPTDKYRAYKNKNEAKKVLGAALKAAYDDVFLADENAQNSTAEKLMGIFAAKTGKGEAVTQKMATTFKALAALADFDGKEKVAEPVQKVEERDESPGVTFKSGRNESPEFHYNIQIHLPATKDISVYNSIFKSLKDHLL